MTGYNGFKMVIHESVCPSVCPSIHLSYVHSYFCFRTIRVNINRFSLNLVCALIFKRSGLGLLRGKFPQSLTELSAHNMSIFLFPDNNFGKCQWIFTKLGTCMCIDIVEIWFGIANGQISSIFDRVVCLDTSVISCALILWRIGLGLLLGTFVNF